MPPVAKPPGQRRRRNTVPTGVVMLPAEGSGRKVPPLNLKGVSPATKAWWKSVWESPMAVMFEPMDVSTLRIAAMLFERVQAGEANGVCRRLFLDYEDRFGLNPRARQRLRWQIAPTETDEERETGTNVVDARARFERLVKSEA